LLSPPNVDRGASLLSDLAREIVRQKAFGLGNSSLTLEDLVRELLRPILKEWLDQNLPYMIERIVKKEIERMVNRSEDF
jgi:cell pole-organizing protein PopZ